jgi:hypothetical protein
VEDVEEDGEGEAEAEVEQRVVISPNSLNFIVSRLPSLFACEQKLQCN